MKTCISFGRKYASLNVIYEKNDRFFYATSFFTKNDLGYWIS